MRPVYVRNFDYDTRQSDLERLFGNYGRVDQVDIKAGYAFVFFEDERDAAEAIRKLDNYPFGYEKRKLSVEWANAERRPRGDRKAKQKPTKTLFVINFDPIKTKERDIEKHFEPYGKVISVCIRRNFSFVQFATQEDATKALEATHRSKILDRVVSVEYASKDGDERDDRYGGGSPRRSLSPAYRNRPSPAYGRPRSPPEYDRYKGPATYERRKSPATYERRRSPAAYERRRSPAAYERRKSPAASERRRRSPASSERRSRSPASSERRRRSPAASERRRRSPAFSERRRRSPAASERRRRSPASSERRRRSPDYGRSNPAYDRYRSRSPNPRGRH